MTIYVAVIVNNIQKESCLYRNYWKQKRMAPFMFMGALLTTLLPLLSSIVVPSVHATAAPTNGLSASGKCKAYIYIFFYIHYTMHYFTFLCHARLNAINLNSCRSGCRYTFIIMDFCLRSACP